MECENCKEESLKMYICQVKVPDMYGELCIDLWKLCGECLAELSVDKALISATPFDGVMAEQLPNGFMGVAE